MTGKPLTCKSCGSQSLAEGEIGHGYANIRPVGKTFSTGSPLILIFCKDCGEVVSMKVKDLYKMRKA